MKVFNRRAIAVFLAVSACVVLAAPVRAEKNIEIFIGGKKFDSLTAYRQYQIDQIRQETATPENPAKEGLVLDQTSFGNIIAGLLQNLSGPTLQNFDGKMASEILRATLGEKVPANQAGQLTGTEQPSAKTQSRER